jgi:membrane protein CcdC involved in cytochrome C biogenesis
MFDVIPSQVLLIGSTILAIMMGTFVMFMRMRSQKKPVSAKKIIIPPVAMSTGALMFVFEEFRVAPLQIVEAIVIGLLFSTVLIATSKFEIRENNIFMKQSKAFPFILLGLLVLRILLKVVFSNSLDVGELGGMFYILAFSMLAPWRIAMLIQYLKIKKAQIAV